MPMIMALPPPSSPMSPALSGKVSERPKMTPMSAGVPQVDPDNQSDTQHRCKIPIVKLDSETIPDTVAAGLASSLLGHVLFLKNQVPLPVLQLARLSNTQKQWQSGNSMNTRARKHRTELLTSFDTLASHLITTFTALSTAFARSKRLDGLSKVHPPGRCHMEAGETVSRIARAFLAILVGPSIGSAREWVFLAVDGLEVRIWGEREDTPPKGASSDENESGGESDQSEDDEQEDSEEEDPDSEEDEPASREDDDKREHASDGHAATSPSPSQSPSPSPLSCSSPPPVPSQIQSPTALFPPLPAMDEQKETQTTFKEESEERERQAQDEDWPDNEATPPPSSPSPPPPSHFPSPSPPPRTRYSPSAQQQALLGAERLLSRTLALADAEGHGLASDMAPTQTHILIRAPRRFSHPAWIPRQNVTAPMEKLLEEFLEESGVFSSSSTQRSVKINKARQKNAPKVGGVWVVSKGSEVGSEARGKEVGEEDPNVGNDEANDENDEMIWWSWDGKLVGFSDW